MPAALKTTILRNGPFIVFLVIATVWMNTRINGSIFIDNDMFRHALDHTSLLSFLHTRYMTWSGRIFIEGALAETIRYPSSGEPSSRSVPFCWPMRSGPVPCAPPSGPAWNSAGHGPVPAAAPRGK